MLFEGLDPAVPELGLVVKRVQDGWRVPLAMVIFGAAGDLTKRLVVPALYDLVSAKRLPERLSATMPGRPSGCLP